MFSPHSPLATITTACDLQPFYFLLKSVIPETTQSFLMGLALGCVLELAGVGSAGHGGNSWAASHGSHPGSTPITKTWPHKPNRPIHTTSEKYEACGQPCASSGHPGTDVTGGDGGHDTATHPSSPSPPHPCYPTHIPSHPGGNADVFHHHPTPCMDATRLGKEMKLSQLPQRRRPR